jgi:hypothetical protein
MVIAPSQRAVKPAFDHNVTVCSVGQKRLLPRPLRERVERGFVGGRRLIAWKSLRVLALTRSAGASLLDACSLILVFIRRKPCARVRMQGTRLSLQILKLLGTMRRHSRIR